MANDALVAARYRPGQAVHYKPGSSKQPDYQRPLYPATVRQVAIRPKGVRVQIVYARDGKVIMSWVKHENVIPIREVAR